jgi:DNA-binding LacI/PurR family transcriptional regulator
MTSVAEAVATLSTVARAAGVSRQTVSNAINAPDRVHPHTLARVRQEIADQGYRPNNRARCLRIQRSCLVGYCVRPPAEGLNPIIDRFIHALASAAERGGHHVLLFTADHGGRSMSAYEELIAHRVVDGFVISDTNRGDRRQGWLTRRGIPFAAFGRRWSPSEIGAWVDVDGAAGTAAAVEHIAGQAHERIAFLGWPDGSGVGDDRRAGWRRACEARGIDTRLVAAATDGIEQGRALAAGLLDLADPPTAFVCVSDTLAIGCLHEVRSRGLEPGRDVAVVGFDDTTAAALPGIDLTSVRQPVDEAGAAVVRLVTDRLLDPTAPARNLLLPPTLVTRASSSRTP